MTTDLEALARKVLSINSFLHPDGVTLAQGVLDLSAEITRLKREVNDGYRRWWYPEEVPSSDVIYPEVEGE